jgi:membrane associated rhomboid family serine protease
MSPSRTGIYQSRGTILLIVFLVVGFGIELATKSIGNDDALLKLGALPDNGQLHGEFWRIATYSFLHFNWLHLILNVALLFFIGRVAEAQVGIGRGALAYFISVIFSAAAILLWHNAHPKDGATVGASGGVFGLLGAALILSYRRGDRVQLRTRLWIILVIAFGVSLLPDISMSGHIGGIIGGVATAFLIPLQNNEAR